MANEVNGTEAPKKAVKSTEVFGDYLIMLIIPSILSIWYYGLAAVSTLAACLITAVVTDIIASTIIRRQYYAADFSAPCSGIMIALMLPASAPVYVGILATAFAVLVIKIPFGGGMRAPFVPAAAGFASAAVCFRDLVFNYSDGRSTMTSVSLGATLASGGSVRLTAASVLDILTGNIYGPMGTGCVIVFVACLVFMFIRRRSSLLSVAGFLGAVIIIALLFPRTGGTRISSLLLELSSGSLMFAAVFMMTDYATQPEHSANKVIYGIFTGVLCMVMRHLGAYEEPVCFAVLLGNAFSPLLDALTERVKIIISSRAKRKEEAA